MDDVELGPRRWCAGHERRVVHLKHYFGNWKNVAFVKQQLFAEVSPETGALS
jgi:hypothetical protein